MVSSVFLVVTFVVVSLCYVEGEEKILLKGRLEPGPNMAAPGSIKIEYRPNAEQPKVVNPLQLTKPLIEQKGSNAKVDAPVRIDGTLGVNKPQTKPFVFKNNAGPADAPVPIAGNAGTLTPQVKPYYFKLDKTEGNAGTLKPQVKPYYFKVNETLLAGATPVEIVQGNSGGSTKNTKSLELSFKNSEDAPVKIDGTLGVNKPQTKPIVFKNNAGPADAPVSIAGNAGTLKPQVKPYYFKLDKTDGNAGTLKPQVKPFNFQVNQTLLAGATPVEIVQGNSGGSTQNTKSLELSFKNSEDVPVPIAGNAGTLTPQVKPYYFKVNQTLLTGATPVEIVQGNSGGNTKNTKPLELQLKVSETGNKQKPRPVQPSPQKGKVVIPLAAKPEAAPPKGAAPPIIHRVPK